ncbi:hypothetical protein DPMN_175208 [Dreissena polymorpha]|uniref:Uncharacterized protein n=1 Tax=Dreissena polymorpha TaxID=45954 RepID=A0A9D4E8W9_DREPO|nr:hypothetical protein DPMN_175208 [Dreissena polymorpha]
MGRDLDYGRFDIYWAGQRAEPRGMPDLNLPGETCAEFNEFCVTRKFLLNENANDISSAVKSTISFIRGDVHQWKLLMLKFVEGARFIMFE